MKMVKSLILGSAAGLVAMSGAQAADLPVKAKAVEYVRICSLYGAGFFYIPGTDTCIKLGGYLRVDTTFNGGVYGAPFWNGDNGQGNRFRDYFISRSRMALTVDTRTATEYGVVRTFGQGDFQFQNFGTSNPTILTAPGVNSALLSSAGGGYVAVEMVFIQFAGFTFGKSASAYATPWHGYPGNNNSFLMGGHDTVTGVNNIQYTAQFGNGVSATIGLDDPTVFHRTSVLNLGVAATPAGFAALVSGHGPCQRLRRHPRSGHRRQHPRRSGLGSVPDFGRGASRERFLQHPDAGGVPNDLFRNQRPPRRQVGRFGDGGVADQEPPDRCRRRHQDRRRLRQG